MAKSGDTYYTPANDDPESDLVAFLAVEDVAWLRAQEKHDEKIRTRWSGS